MTHPDDGLPARFAQSLRRLVRTDDAFVALHEPEFAGDEWALVKDCLDTGWVSSVGKYVDRFEAEVAACCGVPHGVALANGTAALHIALTVAGVAPGDEVLVPALTFVATANAVVHAGAIPHFVDSERRTLGLDPAALRVHLEAASEQRGGRTVNKATGRVISAVVPMHTFGHPVDMDPLLQLAADYGLAVVEDATEALGSTYKGRPCGSIGDAGVFSFNGNKIITTGGGGALVTRDAAMARRAKHLSTTAKVPHKWEFVHDETAFNYRMPNLNAALGCAQLERLPGMLARKRALAQRYEEGFAGFAGLSFVREPDFAASNHWLNAVLLDDGDMARRDAVLDAANSAGLMCRPVWTLMHRLPVYAANPRASLTVAEWIEPRLINIPSSARLGGAG